MQLCNTNENGDCMKVTQQDDLQVRIKLLKNNLEDLLSGNNADPEEILKASQDLDKLIDDYYKARNPLICN